MQCAAVRGREQPYEHRRYEPELNTTASSLDITRPSLASIDKLGIPADSRPLCRDTIMRVHRVQCLECAHWEAFQIHLHTLCILEPGLMALRICILGFSIFDVAW